MHCKVSHKVQWHASVVQSICEQRAAFGAHEQYAKKHDGVDHAHGCCQRLRKFSRQWNRVGVQRKFNKKCEVPKPEKRNGPPSQVFGAQGYFAGARARQQRGQRCAFHSTPCRVDGAAVSGHAHQQVHDQNQVWKVDPNGPAARVDCGGDGGNNDNIQCTERISDSAVLLDEGGAAKGDHNWLRYIVVVPSSTPRESG